MTYSPEQVARVVHEANRALQIEQADPTIPVSPSWDDLDPETQASAISGVIHVRGGATPEQSHAEWVRFKVQHGWTRGAVKDVDRKEHPLLVPYGDLPAEQRVKDALFGAIVGVLAAADLGESRATARVLPGSVLSERAPEDLVE